MITEFAEKYINPFTDFGFEKLFEVAEIAKFTQEQILLYEDSLKYYRDMKNSLDIAFEEGREEGRDHRNNEIAREMLSEGESIQKIIKYTGLSEKKISEIITQQKN